MRSVQSALVLLGRRYLKPVAFTGALGLGFISACAKFPPPGANSNYTQITFSMTVSGEINLNDLYYVVIRSSVPINPSPQLAPTPVANPSLNPNGFVSGSPTQFVMFNAGNELNQPFQLYQFATQAQDPNPSDPTNPINLAVYPLSTLGIITNFTPVNGGTPLNPGTSNTLTFTLYANLIPDITQPAPTTTNPNSQIPTTLQVQFLTMNTTGATSTRVYDYLGTSPGNPTFIQVDLRTSGNCSNLSPAYSNTLSVPVSDPDLNISAWSMSWTTP